MFKSVKYNIMREMANPLSFTLNVIFMMLNNSAFLIQWGVLFTLKDSFGVYGFKEICLIWGISAASYGIAHIFFNGAFRLSKMIEDGALDQYLVLPKDTLMSTITSSTAISAIGDLLYGVIVAFLFYHSLKDIVLISIFIILSAIIYTSFGIITQSLGFLMVKSSDFSESLRNMFITFSIYPESVFGSTLKLIFYTLVPVGFAIYIPVSVIFNFDIINLLIVFAFTIFISLLSYYIFNKGLKKYTSSNLAVSR